MKRLVSFLAAAFVLCGFGLFSENGTVIEYKFTHSGIVEYPRPGTPLACWDFETAVGNYTDDCAATYVMTNNGAAVRLDDATWPAGLAGAQGMAWEFDGAADFLNRADDDTFDFQNDPFSIQFVLTPTTTTAATRAVVAKWESTGNQLSWTIHTWNTSLILGISDDGTTVAGHYSIVTAANALQAHRPAFVTVTYDPRPGDGAAQARIYVDNNATAASNIMDAPPINCTADFEIAARDTGINLMDARYHSLTVYRGIVMTEAQHDEAFSRWQGRSSTAGDGVRVTVTSASPPAIPMAAPASGTEPYIINQPSNSMYIGSPVAGSGGLHSPNTITNICFRRSLETWAAGAPTGWTETSGGGASDATENTTNRAHGGSSAQMVCDGANNLTLDSGCTALVGSQEHQLTGEFITTAGNANFSLQIIECTDGACAVGCAVTNTVYGPGDPGANWIHDGGEFTTAAGTNSGRVRLLIDTNAATVLADAIQLIDFDTAVSAFCPGDTDAAAACNKVVNSIPSPIEGNGVAYIEVTLRTPWDGVDMANWVNFMIDGSSAGNNYFRLGHQVANDEPYIEVKDGAGANRTVGSNVANWAGDTDYTIMIWTSGENQMGIYWNATWYNTEAGAGSGTRNANQTTFYIGSDQATVRDVWTRGLIFYRWIKQY